MGIFALQRGEDVNGDRLPGVRAAAWPSPHAGALGSNSAAFFITAAGASGMSDRTVTVTAGDGAPDVGELTPPDRTLMGPGPSDVHPRVLQAMSTPLVGHLDPSFVEIMDEVQELLRYTFRTDNRWTIPVSGTGSASMETAVGNLVEPGDTMLVPTNGYFGGRMKSMAERAGGEVVEVDAPVVDAHLHAAERRDAVRDHEGVVSVRDVGQL